MKKQELLKINRKTDWINHWVKFINMFVWMLHKVQQQKVVWPDQQNQTFNLEGAEYQNMILNS